MPRLPRTTNMLKYAGAVAAALSVELRIAYMEKGVIDDISSLGGGGFRSIFDGELNPP